MMILAALIAFQEPNPAAWRALLDVPIMAEPVAIDLSELTREQAASKLALLGPQLVRERKEPRILLRAAEWLETLGDPGWRDYAESAEAGLKALEARTPEQAVSYVEALVRLDRLDAQREIDALAESPAKARWEGERLRRNVENSAQLELVPRGLARWLPLSLASLRRPNQIPAWKETLTKSVLAFEQAVKADPKDATLHRLSADAMIAKAYVESADRWLAERKTVALIPLEAFIRYKEAASIATEDPIAQAEAYEVRVLRESEQVGDDPKKWPADATKYLEGVRTRLKTLATGPEALTARQANEVLGLIAIREGRVEEGLAALKLASDPPSERMAWVRFRVLFRLGRLTDAVAAGLEIDRPHTVPDLAFGLVAALDRLNKPDERDALLVDARAHEPTHAGLLLVHAVLQLRKPDGSGIAEARGLLEQANRASLDDTLADELRYARAIYYGILGDLPAARAALAPIRTISPERMNAIRKLAGT